MGYYPTCRFHLPSPAMRGGNQTILMVEDEPSLRVAVRTTLSRLGYRMLEAPNSVNFLSKPFGTRKLAQIIRDRLNAHAGSGCEAIEIWAGMLPGLSALPRWSFAPPD